MHYTLLFTTLSYIQKRQLLSEYSHQRLEGWYLTNCSHLVRQDQESAWLVAGIYYITRIEIKVARLSGPL